MIRAGYGRRVHSTFKTLPKCLRTPTNTRVQVLAAVCRASAYQNRNPVTGTVENPPSERFSPTILLATNTGHTFRVTPYPQRIIDHTHCPPIRDVLAPFLSAEEDVGMVVGVLL